MHEFTPQQIEATKRYFEVERFAVERTQIGGIAVEYFVIPQSQNPALPDFALRMTHTNDTGEVFGIFGVSNSIPSPLRPYVALHEIVEFTEIGIKTQNRCVTAEQRVLSLIPENLRDEYIQRRILFFSKLISFFRDEIEKSPDSYDKEDISEAQSTLALLIETSLRSESGSQPPLFTKNPKYPDHDPYELMEAWVQLEAEGNFKKAKQLRQQVKNTSILRSFFQNSGGNSLTSSSPDFSIINVQQTVRTEDAIEENQSLMQNTSQEEKKFSPKPGQTIHIREVEGKLIRFIDLNNEVYIWKDDGKLERYEGTIPPFRRRNRPFRF